MASEQVNDEGAWFLKSSHPVLLPSHDALTASRDDFEAFVLKELSRRHEPDGKDTSMTEGDATSTTATESFTEVTQSTGSALAQDIGAMDIDVPTISSEDGENTPVIATRNPFIDGLLAHGDNSTVNLQNKTFTANGDLAYISSTNPLVDLFSELEENLSAGPRLRDLLNEAWAEDPLMTVKIIFNARSIHLGKASRLCLYQCAGWLAQNHPLTLVGNLRWLSRPLIEKKVKKVEGDKEDFVLVQEEVDESDPLRFDVKHGLAHGYWKDLLNILAIAANGKLDGLTSPREVLNTENPWYFTGKSTPRSGRGGRRARGNTLARPRGGARFSSTAATRSSAKISKSARTGISSPRDAAKALRRQTRSSRHGAVVRLLQEDAVYRCLHLTVARLFAEQLQADLKVLNGDDKEANVSLCAKWAPTDDHYHDKHTFVISSIAEIMYPRELLDDVLSATDDRETYIRHARERYRKATSALRKHLDVVERKLTEKNYEAIEYDRVPSTAMSNYSKIFIKNDLARFETYMDNVARGKAKISGATLLPSKLVQAAMMSRYKPVWDDARKEQMSATQLMQYKTQQLEASVLNQQWKTLVQRVKDSGSLSSSIAVCDVSGSMNGPSLADSTIPLHSSIGLSLLVAEVTTAPFGGTFITFTSTPQVERVDLSMSLTEKVQRMKRAAWGGSTNFTSVFEDLVLPIAKQNKVSADDMVKRVFVFSDMQFDLADRGWSTSYERIKGLYEDAGYELPELIFWNLNTHSSKPVTVTDEGTALVSGYSQGMLKVFLEGGGFEEEEGEEEVVVTKNQDGSVTETVKKGKTDPLKTVKKAVSHKAYSMLAVLD